MSAWVNEVYYKTNITKGGSVFRIFAPNKQSVLSLHGNMQRKVRATQSAILPNGKDPRRREQKVPQKITAYRGANCAVRVKM